MLLWRDYFPGVRGEEEKGQCTCTLGVQPRAWENKKDVIAGSLQRIKDLNQIPIEEFPKITANKFSQHFDSWGNPGVLGHPPPFLLASRRLSLSMLLVSKGYYSVCWLLPPVKCQVQKFLWRTIIKKAQLNFKINFGFPTQIVIYSKLTFFFFFFLR